MTKLPPEIWNQVFILLHQRDKVECFYEYYQAINNCALLEIGVCPKLTTLRLESNRLIEGDEFVKLLRNTPALKSLKVTFYNFTVDDLESMHHHAPCLESLTLQNALVFCNTPQQNIRPATAMTKLYLQGASTGSIESAQNLFHYIGLKYSNIKELSHTVY
jgi:hypothetical protein